jgi:hypothetical protein
MYKPFYRLPLILVILTLMYSHSGLAQTPIDLNHYQMQRLDQGQLSYYRDPSAEVTLNDILTPSLQNQFQPLSGNLGLGYSPDAVWLKFTLHRTTTQPAHWWLEVLPSYLDSINLTHLTPTGQIEHYASGDFLPLSAKQIAYRNTVFKLNLTPGTHTFYLRIKTTSMLVAILKLWPPDAFERQAHIDYFVFGLYFSLVLTVLLFNLVNGLITRRALFFYYAAYLFLNAFQWFTTCGFVSEFIFPEQPLYANLSLGMSLSLAASLAYIFYAQIYELRRYHPLRRTILTTAASNTSTMAVRPPPTALSSV